MFAFPATPIQPRVFFEESVPALFAEFVLEGAERDIELRIGVVLIADEGDEEGGEWTLHLAGGELGVATGRSPDCDVTIVQRVRDWRSALWEGRPGLIADRIAEIASAGPEALRPPGSGVGHGHPEALEGLSDLQGLIEAVISGEADAGGDGEVDGAETDDWRIGVYLGSGPIPQTPQATIRLGAEQAEAIRRGELHPIEALLTGQLRLEGDLGLILQLQAVAVMTTMPPSTSD